jgi:SAM-dependent methyltransferase
VSELIVSPDCRDENCQKCYGQGIDLQTDSLVPCEHDCHTEQAIALQPSGELYVEAPDPEIHGYDVYPEGYWERGEGSNYRGYADDPGWNATAHVMRMVMGEDAEVWELGCASGYFIRAANLSGMHAGGVDISAYAVAQAPEDVKDYVIEGYATDLWFLPDAVMDAVVSWEMFEHLTVDQIDMAIDEALRVLKPGGRLWFRIALEADGDVPEHDAHDDDTHVSVFSKDQWRQILSLYGLIHDPGSEKMLDDVFEGRDWAGRFFVYVKPTQ